MNEINKTKKGLSLLISPFHYN